MDPRVVHARLFRANVPAIKELCAMLYLDTEGTKVIFKIIFKAQTDVIERIVHYLADPWMVSASKVQPVILFF